MTILLFLTMPAHRALIWSVLGAHLLLPVGASFDLPGAPTLDKATISNLSLLVCCILFVREKWLGAFKDPAFVLLALIFLGSPYFTTYLNPEHLQYGERFLPPMTMYDALSQSVLNIMTLAPFIAAYGLIDRDARRSQLITTLVIAALAYSVLMLLEVRLSPQLHRLVYGYFPHEFGQQMRAGGFRPVVFLGHGLLVAIFCAMAMAASAAAWKYSRGARRRNAGLATAYLGVVLLLCKSLGATFLALIFVPATTLLRARRLAMLSAILCVIVLVYPAARASGLIPTESVVALANSISVDRAESYEVRLVNEDMLLQRASLKPIFGWGSWGRNRIYSDDGKDLSITDGSWIIVFGGWGWIGYVSMFGLLCLGVVRLLWYRRALSSISLPAAALCALLAVNLLDSLPNSSIRPFTWMIAGAVFSIAGSGGSMKKQRSAAGSA